MEILPLQLVILTGLPGSGKTYFAENLAQNFRFAHINSDAVRSRLFAHPQYTLQEHDTVFNVLDILCEQLLASGVSVIYDANVNQNANRNRLIMLAEKFGATTRLVHISSDDTLCWERVSSREDGKSVMHVQLPESSFARMLNNFELPESNNVTVIPGIIPFAQQLQLFQENYNV